MDVGNVKVMDNAQEIARIINSSGRPAAPDSVANSPQTAPPVSVPVKDAHEAARNEKKEAELDKQIKPTMEALNSFLEFMNAEIKFQYHEKTNRMYVQLVSEKDNRVLREYPPKDFLDMVASIREFVGILLDKKA